MLDTIKELDKKYYMNTFGERLPVCFHSGDGIKLYSTEGETFYDLMGGIAVNVLGYSHKRLIDTICEQAKKLLHTSSLYYIESQAKLAEALCKNSFADKAFFCNSGAEANEGAIKLARKYFYNKNIDKHEVITLKNSFHGRTIATISATGQEKYQKAYKPLLEKFIHIEKNDFADLEKAITPKTGAIILELIQGESGVHPLDLEFVKKVRQLCDEKDIVLIFDEIQTGMGRCGKLFAYQLYNIEPDIMSLAKALAGGVPIGAILAKEKFCAFEPGDHGTTFGGNHLATSTALAVLDELLNNGVIENSFSTGAYFNEKLLGLKEKYNIISEIRGTGLMLGIQFNKAIAKEISKKLFDKGFLVGAIGDNTIRLVPPLVITKEEVNLFIENLEGICNIL
jgi:acetylornithine aminotransferase/acetylornithine/N-succinyldiaminopimelate aminotransferase